MDALPWMLHDYMGKKVHLLGEIVLFQNVQVQGKIRIKM